MIRKRVFITGASKGIGRAIAKILLEHSFEVIGTSRFPKKIKDPLDGIRYVQLDMSDPKSIRNCVEAVGPVDILINNAGASQIGPAEEYPLKKTRDLFQVNLFGPIQLIQEFLPDMRKKRSGVIINISSLAGRFAVPFQSTYVSSKFALAGYSWSLRNEVMKYGVKVIVVEPNDIRTTIQPDIEIRDESEYRDEVLYMKNTRDSRMTEAQDPEIVGKKILAILNKKNPDPFYIVGGAGPLMAFAKRILPDRVVESMVRSTYQIKSK